MGVLRALLVLLVADVVWAHPPIHWHSNNSTGSCSEHIGCGNLTKAFEEVQQYGSVVTLELGPGCFDMNSSHVANFTNWNGLAIHGNNTEVCCYNESGLTFISSKNIEIYNVAFYGCEAVQLSTSKNFTENTTAMSYLRLRAGLYFLSCENLAMSSVTVTKTNGIGMVIYNTSGENTFDNCHFRHNVVSDGDYPGGGGVAIEFVYCMPGDPDCDTTVPVVNVTNSTYTFTNCYFEDNNASSLGYPTNFIYPHGIQHMMAGNGGGASVSFKGNAYNNTVVFDNCVFQYNFAEWGGGLYLLYSDHSVSNNVTVQGGWFRMNFGQFQDLDPHHATGGGGVRIHFVYYPQQLQLESAYKPQVERNTILFKGTNFALNVAYWGGAISFSSSRADPGSPNNTNSLVFDTCLFVGNQARIAFAVDLSVLSPDTGIGPLMEPRFTNCRFLRNKALTKNIVGYQLGIGALYVNRVPTVFQGVTTFLGNSGTGLVVSDTGVHVAESSVMNFTGNFGRSGGAAGFFGSAWIVAHENTTFNFVNNSGALKGGAIYAVHFGEHDLFLEQDCFIRYYQHTNHPDTWNATFIFQNNTAKGRLNSIYVTSTLPCVWPSAEHTLTDILQKVFCWDNWRFDQHTNCTTQVTTATAKYAYDNTTSPKKLHSIDIFPGFITPLGLQPLNDYDQLINQTVLTVSAVQDDIARMAPLSLYTAHNTIKMYGIPNKNTSIVVETLDPRIISVTVDVHIQDCPPGLLASYPDSQRKLAHNCTCGDPMYFDCHQNYTATLRRDNCLTQQYFENGTVNPSAPLVVGSCPYAEKAYALPKHADELDKFICDPSKRTGTLCGRCKPNYGVTVNTYRFDCVNCEDYTFNWFYYIAAEFFPITLFFLIVTVFNVSATSAPMNAFVFFSQIVTVPYFQNRFPWVYGITHKEGTAYEDVLLILYSIWNLDFFKSIEPGFCLSPYLDTIKVLALGYLTAFYPLLLIAVFWVCIQLYGRNFRLIVWLWKPFWYCCYRFRRSWEPKTSIIDAFATFILLSYTKFMFVSFCLLSPIHLHNVSGKQIGSLRFYFDASVESFHGEHIGFAILAIVVLGIFVVIPPLFLFIYPLKIFQKCIGSCGFPCHALHTFADTFQGCYKDGTTYGFEDTRDCRYFAGLYFVFRIVVLSIYISQPHPMLQCLIQQVLCTLAVTLFAMVQPYKQSFYNKLDISFFTLLAILNSLSFYNCFSVFSYQHISEAVFYLNYVLMHLPLLYIIGYVTYLLLGWKKWIGKWQKRRAAARRSFYSEGTVISSEPSSTGNETLDSYTYNYEDEDVPDRLLNPQNYSPKNTYRPVGANRAFNSDNSYFSPHPSGSRRNYGSTQTSGSRRDYGSAQTHLSDTTETQEFRKLA